MFRQILIQERLKMEILGVREDPYTDIKSSLEKIKEELEKKKIDKQVASIDWSFVRRHLGKLVRLDRNSDYFDDIFFYIFRLFNLYHCRNFSVIADLIQIQCFAFEYSPDSFRRAKRMTDRLRKNMSCCGVNGLNFVAKLMRVPYKSSDSSYSFLYDAVQMFIICAEDIILKMILEYGVMYIQLSDHRSTWEHCHHLMSGLLPDQEKPLLLPLNRFQANFKELTPETRRRMLAVFRGIEVILRSKIKIPQLCERAYGLCFRMAWETIPEPVITSQEIVAFLELALEGQSADTTIGAIRRSYEKLFPESCEPLSPRTLKFLSRCQVRQNLRQQGNFPFGIKDLEVPLPIRKYIYRVKTDHMKRQFNTYRK